MEFHFPIFRLSSESREAYSWSFKIEEIFDGISADECRRIEGDGYLKGLIDLIFEKTVSIPIDWKSNILNGTSEGFGQKGIEREMLTHDYVLQYHIYTVALHRFLRSRMKGYRYERNFGGVYYLFVRGMKKGSDRGIFYDFPDSETVQALEKFLV